MGIFEIFLKPIFWIIMGALYVFIFYSATIWVKDLGLKMNFWKWTLVTIWFLLLSLTLAGGFTLIGEKEVSAGLYFLGFFIVVNFILGILIWRLLTFNREKQGKSKK